LGSPRRSFKGYEGKDDVSSRDIDGGHEIEGSEEGYVVLSRKRNLLRCRLLPLEVFYAAHENSVDHLCQMALALELSTAKA
jgi:hypothetical protein